MRTEGALDAMPAGDEASTARNSIRSTSLCPAEWHVRPGPRRTASRPLALGLIGLALAVTLWGFGYKLSRYNPPSDVTSRALFAKLWDKHQDVAQASNAVHPSPQPHVPFDFHAFLVVLSPAARPGCFAARRGDEAKPISVLFESQVPPRSPPFRNFAA